MKRKICFSLFLFLLCGMTVYSQTYVFQAKQKGSRMWGYANLNGEMIIEQQFKVVTKFCEEGIAMVNDGDYIMINLKGEPIPMAVLKIRPMMDAWATPNGWGFHGANSGIIVTKNDGKWGALGPEGIAIAPFRYDRITDFNNGFALAERDKSFFVLDRSGNEIPVQAKGIKEIKHFSGNLGIIEVKGELWGFVGEDGQTVIEPRFKGVGYFNGDITWARADNGKIGYIDKMGNWVIEPQFEKAKEFDQESGMAVVSVGNGWGYVDINGNINVFEKTSKVFDFSEGLALGRKNKKIGYLNTKGEWAVEPQFSAGHPFQNGFAAVQLDGLWGLIDKEGNWEVVAKFTDIGGVALVK